MAERHNAETTAIAAGRAATYGGATGAVVSGMSIPNSAYSAPAEIIFTGFSLSEIGVIVGIAVGVLGFFFGQYWSWRRDKREARELEVRMLHKYGTNWDEPE